MNEYSQIQELKGVGPKIAPLLHKMGIYTIEDLLNYYPRDYESYSSVSAAADAYENMSENRPAIYRLRIKSIPVLRYVKGYKILTCIAEDETGILELSWFNQPYYKNQLVQGHYYLFRGNIKQKGASLILSNPKIIKDAEYEKLKSAMSPVYTVTKGISTDFIRKLMSQALKECPPLYDYMDSCSELKEQFKLMGLNEAVKQLHFPVSMKETVKARERLVFDEFLMFMLNVRRLREDKKQCINECIIEPADEVKKIIASLPYELTGAQLRTIKDIEKDMASDISMNRLVEGDVGSGKTIVAFAALLDAVFSGYQGALMAPTEVLARQHYEGLVSLLDVNGIKHIRCALLTGSVTAKEKKNIKAQLLNGEIDIAIGTHALIQDDVQFKRLGLVITDEQHRFGVKQRMSLYEAQEKMPHTLVMSATPIPRTLAVIIYGDLDISIIDEKPKSRLPIKNCAVGPDYRAKAYNFIEKEVAKGRQALVVCPMVEESEGMEGENVIDYTLRLREQMTPAFCIEYLHGRMKNKEKAEIMERFSRGEINILVSTTVIEVGIDVPNTTVMMVENAERFGLSQLHQLRGRVGRGEHQSYCIFMSSSKSKTSVSRLETLVKYNDGFKVAEEDMRQRGPGDVFGIRQSGELGFRLGDIYTDAATMKNAAIAADFLMNKGFWDENSEYGRFRDIVMAYCQSQSEKVNL